MSRISHIPVPLLVEIVGHLSPFEILTASTTMLSVEMREEFFNTLCHLGRWSLSRLNAFDNNATYTSLFLEFAHAPNTLQSANVSTTLSILTTFDRVDFIQVLGLERLAVLTELENERMTCYLANGIPTILHAMKHFPSNTSVQSTAARAIVTMARPFGSTEGGQYEPTNQKLNLGSIVGTPGVHLILSAMQLHVASAEVQANCCWALVNLALDSVQKKSILVSGGLELVVYAMFLHKHDRNVQFRALFCLINLVASAPVHRELPPHLLPMIVHILEKNREDSDLIGLACMVLKNLSSDLHHLAVLRTNPGPLSIQLEATLAHFAKHPTIRCNAHITLARILPEPVPALAA